MEPRVMTATRVLPKVSGDIQLVGKIIDERTDLKKIIDSHVQS